MSTKRRRDRRLNGRELMRDVHDSGQSVPVLFMSGYAPEEAGSEGSVVAEAPALNKPFSADWLGHAVRRARDANPRTA